MKREDEAEGNAPDSLDGFDGFATSESTPSGRVLQAVEMLTRSGPMTYKELGEALDMTRAATWRLVATLREARWVCIRHGGTVIQLAPRLDELFANAAFADAEFSDVANILNEVATTLSVHCDLFSPNRMGELVLNETSRRLTAASLPIDLPDDLLTLAMHAAMTPPQLERHLAQLQAREGENGLHLVGTPARRRIQQFPGQILTMDRKFLVIAIRGTMGTAGALRITSKTSAAKPSRLIVAFNTLRERLQGKLEMFGNGGTIVTQAERRSP